MLSRTSGLCVLLAAAISCATALAAPRPSPLEAAPLEAVPVEAAAATAASSPDFWSMAFVLLLATFIGIGVIRRVSRLLHTPLMSLTNAISAICVVGAIIVAGGEHYPWGIKLLGAIALFASMTNIVSGFLITDRMLKMFRQVRPSASAAGNGSASGGQSPTVSPAS